MILESCFVSLHVNLWAGQASLCPEVLCCPLPIEGFSRNLRHRACFYSFMKFFFKSGYQVLLSEIFLVYSQDYTA